MCGEHLPERTAKPEKRPTGEVRETAPPVALSEEAARSTERRERIAEHDPEPVAANLRHREEVDETVRESELPAAVADFYSSGGTTEEPTTVSGPSFLGLSSGTGSSSGYSYLYEDEQPKSHAGSLAFLLFLAIVAAGVYWKWQPIKDYVVNAALTHSQTGRAAPSAAPTQPGSTTASSDNSGTQPGQPTNPNGLPQQGNAGAVADQPKTDQPKSDSTPKADQATPPAAKGSDKTSAPKDEQPQSEVGHSSRFQKVKSSNPSDEDTTEDNEKPSARRSAKTAGTELVDTGERYLYGRGVSRNCNQALVNFQAAAKQDNPRAMSHLGSLYATGQCVPLDRAQAYQWFSRALAADRSNTYLEHNLNMLWRDMSSNERAKATQKRMF